MPNDQKDDTSLAESKDANSPDTWPSRTSPVLASPTNMPSPTEEQIPAGDCSDNSSGASSTPSTHRNEEPGPTEGQMNNTSRSSTGKTERESVHGRAVPVMPTRRNTEHYTNGLAALTSQPPAPGNRGLTRDHMPPVNSLDFDQHPNPISLLPSANSEGMGFDLNPRVEQNGMENYDSVNRSSPHSRSSTIRSHPTSPTAHCRDRSSPQPDKG
jgi:hypothetical protein